jgi:hypothetical protein
MVTNRKPQKVYVSYARSDALRVESILAKLAALGLVGTSDDVISDKDLEPKHGVLRDGVRRLVQSASKVVVVWSKASAESQWVNYEIGLADAFGKSIIPVVRRDELSSLPLLLKGLQVVVIEDDS